MPLAARWSEHFLTICSLHVASGCCVLHVACCMLKRALQRDHFLMIFELAKRAGWFVDERDRLDHVGFGMVCGEDKKP